jgi:hypothetical protein
MGFVVEVHSRKTVEGMNAFTAAAQTLAPLQRIEVERFAGTLLAAPLQ